MNIIRYQYPILSSVAPVSDLQAEMARLFDAAFPNISQFQRSQNWNQELSLDVFQDKEAYHARLETPGFRKEDVSLEVADGVVTVTAHQKTEPENGKPVSQERRVTRAFTVPPHADPEKIQAKYENGVLLVTLPKREEAKPRSITVDVK